MTVQVVDFGCRLNAFEGEVVRRHLAEAGAGNLVAVGDSEAARIADAPKPGYGIPSLAVMDTLVLFTVLLMGAALVLPERVQGRVQGCATLIVSFLALLGAIVIGRIRLRRENCLRQACLC